MKVPNTPHRHREQVHRRRGNEAPMVIWPRDVARLLRQLFTAIRGTKK